MIWNNAINPLLLHQFVTEDKHCVFVLDQADLGSYREEIIFNDKCLPTKENSSVQLLVGSIGKLKMSSASNSVESQVLCKVKKETRFITTFFLARSPSIRRITSYNLCRII